jgi:hypothetical protein
MAGVSHICSRWELAVHAFAWALGLVGCAVDDRHLEEGGAGAAGPLVVDPSGNSGGVGDGSAGGSSSPSDLVDGCADLDTDGIADCTTTLVENPTFTSDASGWTPVADAEWAWDPKNALDDTPSGSGRLSAGTPRPSAVQCVAIAGQQLVIGYVSVFVEAPDDTASANQAELDVSYFASSDCSGPITGYFDAPPSAMMGAWTTVHAGSLSPTTTASALVALTGVKADDAATVTAYFDNVMVKTKAPSP